MGTQKETTGKIHLSNGAASVPAAALLLVAGAGIYVFLDVATHSMFYTLPITTGFAAFFIVPAFILLWRAPLSVKLEFLSTFLLCILAVRNIEWNSRKPFLRDLGVIQTGMTREQVDSILGIYLRSPRTGFSELGTVGYRHTDEGWGNADVALVTFADGRVAKVEYFPD